MRIGKRKRKKKKKERKKIRHCNATVVHLIKYICLALTAMGLLSEGRPLKWTEIKDALKQIRTYGVNQLIQVYHKCKNRQRDAFTWGDEVRSSV